MSEIKLVINIPFEIIIQKHQESGIEIYECVTKKEKLELKIDTRDLEGIVKAKNKNARILWRRVYSMIEGLPETGDDV